MKTYVIAIPRPARTIMGRLPTWSAMEPQTGAMRLEARKLTAKMAPDQKAVFEETPTSATRAGRNGATMEKPIAAMKTPAATT